MKRSPNLEPLVHQILEAMNDSGSLSLDDLRAFLDEMGRLEAPRPVCVELIALALRFRDAGASEAMLQMILLVSAAMGQSASADLLKAHGLPSQKATRLVSEARGLRVKTSGLQVPVSGVGLRRKK